MNRRDFLCSTLAGATALIPGSGGAVNWDWITSAPAVPAVPVEPLMPMTASFTNIFRAADSGFINDVKYFIEQMGINVNVKGMYGFTPLHWAAGRCRSLEIVQYLVAQGADIHMKDKHGETPLVLAVSHGSLDVVQYLVSQGADVHTTEHREPLVNIAASHGNWDIVKYLVEQGADVKRDAGSKPLHSAISADHLEMVQYLIANGVNVNSKDGYSNAPLHCATSCWSVRRKNSLAIAQCLVSHGADIHAKGSTGNIPLHNAARSSSLDVVQYLISLGSDVNAKETYGDTPLHNAASNGNLEIVQYLVSQGAEVDAKNDKGFTPLHRAAEYNKMEIVQYLVSQGAKVDAKATCGATPLYSAAGSYSKTSVETLRYLVSQGVDVHVLTHEGKTPLHSAYHEEVVLYLISQGVEMNAKDINGRTPLHGAAERYGNATKLKCLIAKGADVNVKDNAGKTPLHDAVADIYWMRLEMVQDLVSHGADVHAKDVKGNTPLHIAAASTGNYYVGKRNILKQADILKFLIASGADVNAKNHQGETPLDVAQIDESKHVLQEAGAVLGTTSLLSVAGLTVNEGMEKQSPTKHQSHNRESANNQTPKPKNERNDRNKFTDYIWVDSIIPIIKATDRDGVIREMVQSLVDAGGVKKEDYESIVKALIKREELGSTGIGRGIAMPHTKYPSVKRNVGTVAISAEGIDFDCLDEEKAHLFFLVLSPPDFPGDHLRVMEHLTRHLKDDTFRCSLMQAKTREEIIALLEEDDNCERR